MVFGFPINFWFLHLYDTFFVLAAGNGGQEMEGGRSQGNDWVFRPGFFGGMSLSLESKPLRIHLF